MGNRAAVTFIDSNNPHPNAWVYLHWNGGPESVYPMVDALKRAGRLNHSAGYSLAQFASLAVQFVSGSDGLSVGIDRFANATNAAYTCGDNGAYVFNISTGEVKRTIAPYGVEPRTRVLTKAEVAREIKQAHAHAYTVQGLPSDLDAYLTKPEKLAA